MSEELKTKFEEAAAKARQTPVNSIETKTQLYGLYKQATEGPNSNIRPGIFNQVARQKHDAWAFYGDMDKDEAKRKYIDLVETI